MMSGPGAEPARGPSPEVRERPAGFGTATATFVIVSSMVGVGVLTTSGFTVYFVGSNGLMLVLWAAGGACALCGALTMAELSAALPRSGGEYVFLLEAYGPPVAFLSGWVSFLIGFAGPIAVLANASATYLLAPLGLEGPASSWAHRAVATAAIAALAVAHASGHRQSARVQGWATSLKLVVLGLFIVAGLAVGWPRRAQLADWPEIDLPVVRATLFSMIYIFYAYTGWNAASYLAGEVEDPGRRLPRAIVLGTAVVVALYLGLNAVYALALPAAEVRAIVDDPANALGLDAV
jgi:basic amino acid/polyamine antiporter, APA family